MRYFLYSLSGLVIVVLLVLLTQTSINAAGKKGPKQPPVMNAIKGVEYNPVAIGTDNLDSSAPIYDVSKIAAIGANTIGTYNAGLFEWGNQSDIDVNVPFYTALADAAEKLNLKIIVGYFANSSIDWTSSARQQKTTTQFQSLVLSTKNRPSTSMYLIGNELFENLPNDASREAYARWVGTMVDWTHAQNSSLKVTYADNHALTALPWLKKYAPNLDIYSINSYEWATQSQLEALIDRFSLAWPNKKILLHEWGVDSYDATVQSENGSAQASQVTKLANIINSVLVSRPQLLGSVYFEYSDQWDKAGNLTLQDSTATGWKCSTCFDSVANEEYWGLGSSVGIGQSNNRFLKQAYYSLRSLWVQ